MPPKMAMPIVPQPRTVRVRPAASEGLGLEALLPLGAFQLMLAWCWTSREFCRIQLGARSRDIGAVMLNRGN